MTTRSDSGHTSEFIVTGMTCEHCAKSVTEEVHQIDGVTGVAVDLGTGVLTVASNLPISDVAVRAAVEEAGYHLS